MEIYGKGFGDHIALNGKVPEDVEGFLDCLWHYSAYPPSFPKILKSLETTGRYECTLKYSWFRAQYGILKADLSRFGIELEVVELSKLSKAPLNESLNVHRSQPPHPRPKM